MSKTPKNKTANPKRRKTQNEKSKECMRKLREKIKNDPVLHEEEKRKARERYRKRKEAGNVKLINDLSEREKRRIRKQWKERSKRTYNNKKAREKMEKQTLQNTPPSTPTPEDSFQAGPSRQSLKGKKNAIKYRLQLKKEISELKEKLRQAVKKKEKYRKRLQRTNRKMPNTPNKRVSEMLKGQQVTPEVKKKLIFGEVLKDQLKNNFDEQKQVEEKRQFVTCISGRLVKKYRIKNIIGSVTSRHLVQKRSSIVLNKRKQVLIQMRKIVEEFYEKDEVSRLCPGKKDTVTFRKIKKQKRYLNDKIENIHKKFLAAHPKIKIGYSTFCKLRPFWVVIPNAKLRDTCLCIQHANMLLITNKLKAENIISSGGFEGIIQQLCCVDYNEDCLSRTCETCLNNEVKFMDYTKDDPVQYEKWGAKKVEVAIKGKNKICQKTIKEKIECKKEELVQQFLTLIPKFLIHLRNIKHQYQSTDYIKHNLLPDEVFIHIDFSENYTCKYACEIQSAHFGGSKLQISIHTVVFYYYDLVTSKVAHVSIATLSENLRHDPSAICAHLDPVITEILKLTPTLKFAHFLSDGPSTQYKNKSMFYLMVNYLTKKLGVETLRWHYSESGHGKGAPDGVGATIKRAADNAVGYGSDIPDFDTLINKLSQSNLKVICLPIFTSAIEEIDKLVPNYLKPFKGTMSIHEVMWTNSKQRFLQARKLTCLACKTNSCCHYEIGFIDFTYILELEEHGDVPSTSKIRLPTNIQKRRIRYHDVYSDSDDNCENNPSTLNTSPSRYQDTKLASPQASENNPTVKPNDYAVVKVCGKKSISYFIGFVLEVNFDKVTVKFMTKYNKNKYVFPEKDDISTIFSYEIISVLSEPELNKRQQYTFKSLPYLKNL